MHEQALIQDLRRKLDELSSAASGARIVRARVALGRLCHVDAPRLVELWGRAMAGGPAAQAILEVETVPAVDDPAAASLVLRSVTFAEGSSASPGSSAPEP